MNTTAFFGGGATAVLRLEFRNRWIPLLGRLRLGVVRGRRGKPDDRGDGKEPGRGGSGGVWNPLRSFPDNPADYDTTLFGRSLTAQQPGRSRIVRTSLADRDIWRDAAL